MLPSFEDFMKSTELNDFLILLSHSSGTRGTARDSQSRGLFAPLVDKSSAFPPRYKPVVIRRNWKDLQSIWLSDNTEHFYYSLYLGQIFLTQLYLLENLEKSGF